MSVRRCVRIVCQIAALATLAALPAAANEFFVAPGGAGSGTSASPFGRIQDGINAAQPGDTVTVKAGTYAETLKSVRSGTSSAPITVRAAGNRGSVVVTVKGRVLTVAHAYITVTGLVMDGQYGTDDVVRVGSAGNAFRLRDSEVRRSTYDGIDMTGASDVLIEGSLVHHTLNAANGRTDAHGIVASAVHRLTIRNTEIHTFSGDAFQIDPSRSAPGWSDVLLEGCTLWLAPLAQATNGFAAGAVPGENAVDTKADSSLPRATITIRNTEARGFRGGLINNMAAFNLKENIDAVLDGVTVKDSEIAFRMRGPSSTQPAGAWVRVQNAVVHDSATAFRYEDTVQNARIWNSTVGGGVTRAFTAASSSSSGLDVRNLLVLGSSLPAEAAGPSNLAVSASAFVNAGSDNYQLADAAPALDTGVALAQVTADRQGTPRPQGRAADVGAYERVVSTASEIVLYAAHASNARGAWYVTADASAAGGGLLANPDAGVAKLQQALAQPADYFEMTFYAEAGKPYRLWMRGRAERNQSNNDSVFAQFSDSLNASGTALYRIGTTSSTTVNLEDCRGCGLAGWGWQDNGFGADVLGRVIYFAHTGTHTIRIQPREDGLSVDQIVLSSSAYLSTAPGTLKNDTTMLPESGF